MTDVAGGALRAAELEEFLAQPLLLKLACVRPDGWPYVIPLWYAWSERKLYVVGRARAGWIDYIAGSGSFVPQDASQPLEGGFFVRLAEALD